MNFSWIHLENLKFFMFLGATDAEQLIGQNITLSLSLCVSYQNTEDNIANTIDYGKVYECLAEKINSLKRVQLLEYLVEQIFEEIHKNFSTLYKARIVIQKGYVPLKNFSGTVRIEAEKQFIF